MAPPFAVHLRLPVEAEIPDLPVAGARMPTADGRRSFIAAPCILNGAEIGVGDMAEMRVWHRPPECGRCADRTCRGAGSVAPAAGSSARAYVVGRGIAASCS